MRGWVAGWLGGCCGDGLRGVVGVLLGLRAAGSGATGFRAAAHSASCWVLRAAWAPAGRGYMDVNRISGYLPGKMVFFLMQVGGLHLHV